MAIIATTAEERIRKIFSALYIGEPVLNSVALSHRLVAEPKAETIRVGDMKIEYNPAFIDGLSDVELKSTLFFELFRILLKHPYERSGFNKVANFVASNVTVQENTKSCLGMPSAREVFGSIVEKGMSDKEKKFVEMYDKLKALDEGTLQKLTGLTKDKLESFKGRIVDLKMDELDKRHLEFYYGLVDQNMEKLIQNSDHFSSIKDACENSGSQQGEDSGDGDGDSEGRSSSSNKSKKSGNKGKGEQKEKGEGTGSGEKNPSLEDHFDPIHAWNRQKNWGSNELAVNEINDIINTAQTTNNWGSVPGDMQGALVASLKPKVDYKAILRQFHASIISSDTYMNRMRPNRRYGFGFPGRKHDFNTRLAFFVDVSGSMDDNTLKEVFSTINRFFKYGIKTTDVFQFDTELKDETPMTMKKAQEKFKIKGRGGTDFQCIFDRLAKEKKPYDGIIVCTDGYAPAPRLPKNVNPRKVLFLYNNEENFNNCFKELSKTGVRGAFIKGVEEY